MNSKGNPEQRRKKLFKFMERLTMKNYNNKCDPGLIETGVDAKLTNLKSTLSKCPDYCRISVNPEGLVYGAKNFSLDSMHLMT
jgi:hypothetical protein